MSWLFATPGLRDEKRGADLWRCPSRWQRPRLIEVAERRLPPAIEGGKQGACGNEHDAVGCGRPH